MKKIFTLVAVILAVTLLFTSCLGGQAAKVVTTTITVPQYITNTTTNTVTQTQILPTTVTLPPAISTVTPPAVTSTITVTSPAITTTVTTTATATVTVAPPSVLRDVVLTLSPFTTANIDGSKMNQVVYYVLTYKNNALVEFNNVRFKLTFITNFPSGLAYIGINALSGIIPDTTIWNGAPLDNVYSFTMLQSITIPKNSSGEIYLAANVILGSLSPTTYSLAASPAIVNIV